VGLVIYNAEDFDRRQALAYLVGQLTYELREILAWAVHGDLERIKFHARRGLENVAADAARPAAKEEEGT
jgi:hypothetical protein